MNKEPLVDLVLDNMAEVHHPHGIHGNCPSAWGIEFQQMCRGNSRPPTDKRCRKCWKNAFMVYEEEK